MFKTFDKNGMSGMEFIADNAFHIEKSPLYTQLGNSVKTVEFVRNKDDKLLFVEAKSSFPNPDNIVPNPKKENKTGAELFADEISEICDKFIHSLNLYSAINVGIVGSGFPSDYKPSTKMTLVFYLVINHHEESWCDKIKKALTNKLRDSLCITEIWKPIILVINDKIAESRGLTTGL